MLPLIVFLLVIALILILVETFVPFGIPGTIGWLLIALSAYLCVHEYGWGVGLAYLAASAALAFSLWLTAFLAVSRRLALSPPDPKDKGRGPQEWIGAKGVATKNLNPTGYVEIEGKRHSARAEMTHVEIPRGTEVIVTGVDGSYLLVKTVERRDSPSAEISPHISSGTRPS